MKLAIKKAPAANRDLFENYTDPEDRVQSSLDKKIIA